MHFHQIVLKHLLEYRDSVNSDFNFLVRQRASKKDKNYEGGKFAHGLVFQGNDTYCFVPLIDRSGGANATKSVGLVFCPEHENLKVHLEIVFLGETDQDLIKFYKLLSSKFENVSWDRNDQRAKIPIASFHNEDYKLIFDWLDKNYSIIKETALKTGIKNLIPSDERFNTLQKKLQVKLAEAKIEITDKGVHLESLINAFRNYLSVQNYASSTIVVYTTNFEICLKSYLKQKKIIELTPFDYIYFSNIPYTDFESLTKESSEHVGKGRKHFMSFFNNKVNTAKMELKPPTLATNQILYGPPGTGKTYATKKLAVELIDQISFGDTEEDRLKILSRYDELEKNAQVVFTTFHQSMSYEDFVEGIKPKTEANEVVYGVEDGIFKQLSLLASKNYGNNESSFEERFEKLVNEWEESEDGILSIEMAKSNFVITKINSNNIFFEKKSGSNKHNLVISTLRELYEEKRIMKSGLASYYYPIIDKLKSYVVPKKDQEKKNYVLIIDEINRGNVSAIFGELITLLEPDKRLGQKEAISVTLPYSQTDFGIPSNLHIIGTMNTADRSVEALDSALRRRFSFKEIMPDPDIIAGRTVNTELGASIALSDILKTINQRIELLLDRDHTIGHSYFFKVNSLNDLANVFNNKIIPLLQEYFYGDYGKIGLVLGSGFVTKKNNAAVEFAKFEYENAQDFKNPSFTLKEVNENSVVNAVELLLGTIV